MFRKVMLVLVVPIVFAVHGLQQELVTLKSRLASLERVLGEPSSGPIIDKPIGIVPPSDPKPQFYANYRYILSDSQAVLFKANNSQILYEIGLVDSGYIKVENNKTKLKRVTKKENKKQNEKEVEGPIYNIVAYGPELKPEVLETNFKVIIVKENKTINVLGINKTVPTDTYHIQYPTDFLMNVQNHIINPLVKKVYVLQDTNLIDTISQLLENSFDHIAHKATPEIDKNFPNATNPLPTYDAARSFLEKEKKYLDERFFNRYMPGGSYDPAKCVRLYGILPKMKELTRQVSMMVEILKKRNTTYGYLWKDEKNFNQSRSVVEEINDFLLYLEPKLKQLHEHLDKQKQLITVEFQGKLDLFKKQLMNAKQENTLSLEPILFPKVTVGTSATTQEELTEVEDDEEDDLMEEYKLFKNLKDQKRIDYFENEDNQAIKQRLQVYKQLMEKNFTKEQLEKKTSARLLLEWLDEWNRN